MSLLTLREEYIGGRWIGPVGYVDRQGLGDSNRRVARGIAVQERHHASSFNINGLTVVQALAVPLLRIITVPRRLVRSDRHVVGSFCKGYDDPPWFMPMNVIMN